MIFSISDDFFIKINNNEEIDFFEYIIGQIENIMKSNNNVLIVESNYILVNQKCLLDNSVDERLSKIISYLCSMFPQYYSLKYQVSYRVILNFDLNQKNDDKTYLKWSYLKENNINLGDKVTLLTEDSKDGDFYENIVKNINIMVSGTTLNFHYNNGGGSSIDFTYQICVNKNEDFVFAIVDSDKKHPKDKIGNTGEKLSKVYKKSIEDDCLHSYLTILKVHEKENLIMPSEYKKNSAFQCNQFEYLIKMEQDKKDYLFYYDLKKGIKSKDFNGELKEYYDNLIKEYPELYINENGLALPNFSKIVKKEFEFKYLNISSETYIYKIRSELCKLIYSFGISVKHHIA